MIFEKVIGNDKIKNYFNKCIIENNILHSYLFLGKEGIGKLLFAKEFAKYILCLNEKNDSCSCKSCVCFDSNNHPDFFIINEESETIKIDQIRVVIDRIIEKPIVSQKKVYIINDCEKMTKEAQNCLLKTLEEPPEYVVIILISSNENLLLNTIKSRCTSIKFNNINEDDLRKYINDNLDYEYVSDYLLKYFDGSIGKAIKTQEKKEKFIDIENNIKDIKNKNIIDFIQDFKIIYDKENILEYLDYIIVCLYEQSISEKKYLNCIQFVNECISKIKANAYLDMTIDIFLFNIWEELNEKSFRS